MAKEETSSPPRDDILRFVAKTAVIAVVIYMGFYSFDQWMRKKDGPWEVTFAEDSNGTPMLVVNWETRGYIDCRIVFPGESVPLGFKNVRTNYVDPVHLPLQVPFGQWFYADLTYLPGTVTYDLFGEDANGSSRGRRHEIELLPRALVVNRKSHPWRAGMRIEVPVGDKRDWQETDVKY